MEMDKYEKAQIQILNIIEIPCGIIIIVIFSYRVIYRWFFLSQWETMHELLRIALLIFFAVFYCLYFRSMILFALSLKKDRQKDQQDHS